jgi:methylphosphotriester-DNA--protein-cysteine methyltransferase
MKFYTVLKDNHFILSNEPGIYAGNRPGKIFGRLDCISGKSMMKKENRVFFLSLDDAVSQGYRPCRKCKPMDENDFEKVKELIPYSGITNLKEFYKLNQK